MISTLQKSFSKLSPSEHLYSIRYHQKSKSRKFNIKRYAHRDQYIFPKNKTLAEERDRIERQRVVNRERSIVDKQRSKDVIKIQPVDMDKFEERTLKRPGFVPVNSKALNVSIIGFPNAGKSTLLNRLIGKKLCPVSPKQQTTRENLMGILTEEEYQFVFLDTPGIIPLPEYKSLPRSVIVSGWQSLSNADVVLFLLDSVKTFDKDMHYALDRLRIAKEEHDLKICLVLNKVDLLPTIKRTLIYEPLQRLSHVYPNWKMLFDDTLTLSALTGHKVQELKEYMKNNAIEKKWEFSPEMTTDVSDYKVVSEMIRERLFRKFNMELPYVMNIKIDGWTKILDDVLRIDATIEVQKESQKWIIVGPKGSNIRSVRNDVASDISNFLDCQVDLRLGIRVSKGNSHPIVHN